ncbi:inositol 2-dehydrogenase [Gracilibacillus alcaliphilus]|uniref:inositol 2-dehydrogenase n=1 Tax=Gracilibacillus alcaliphilus TaxID=1401441 RepID=UPI00195C8362|nr:inositol 2-dehydrogenase [Gracilibacillus alcaliphilus]MBM7676734.1 myo-inositol 2-dehydrogenase/D-chiro-inositol 1-dehydrogenase [Gracilibacillus alcaliphilus]
MSKVTVGIIGAGRIGQLHARNILLSDNYQLKGISDVYTDHIKDIEFLQAVPVITNEADDIFHDPEIDAIFICSSTDTHIDFITKAAQNKKHIFCEKPISFDIEKTRSVLETVKEHDVKFQVGFNRRFDHHFRKAYDVVREGTIGTPHIIKITSRDPEAPPEEYIKRSGGLFIDMAIHDFDMIRYLSGQPVQNITVKAASLVDEKFSRNQDVDTAIITITFADGSLGVIDNSRQAVYGYDQRIEVFGNQGMVQVENEKPTNVKISTSLTVTEDKPKYFFLERYNEGYIAEINEFAQSILSDRPVLATFEDGLQAELLALAARKSWQENRTVELTEFDR